MSDILHRFHPTVEWCATDQASSLIESRGNLFSRLALRHGNQAANTLALTQGVGFGPDAFIAPILGGAIDTIVVKISEKYITYFMKCISSRYTGFLTGWGNDDKRPFVIIWQVMDVLRDMQNLLKAVQIGVRAPADACLVAPTYLSRYYFADRLMK